jgi:UDP-4-amino-4,6-dideoxy-N-acetyl-beta-L-altrosamine N-acetyltransferase
MMRNYGALTFKNILDLDERHQKIVLDLRNSESIRKHMYTNRPISLDEHFSWIDRLKTDTSNHVFTIFFKDSVVGSVALNKIDEINSSAYWDFYMDEKYRRIGLAAIVEYEFLNYTFFKMGIEKLNSEVLGNNDSVVNLHKKYGFHEEGVLRENIMRDGERIGVHLIGILKREWESARPEVQKIISAITHRL